MLYYVYIFGFGLKENKKLGLQVLWLGIKKEKSIGG
jgi:hypothetical protein